MNKLLQDVSLLLPRFNIESVSIIETGNTGFGDRLRGVSLALLLASRHRVKKIYYDDHSQVCDMVTRQQAFPFSMCDLIQLEGLELKQGKPAPPEKSLQVIHNSTDNSKLNLLGFRYFHRVKPANDLVGRTLDRIGVDKSCVGLHVRGTDALETFRYLEGAEAVEKRALDNLKTITSFCKTKSVFVASDSRDSHSEWIAKLREYGYDVKANTNVDWKVNELRQTGSDAMLIDFFGLARCAKVVRLVPSEFSRYAAWKAGQKLRYMDLV